MISIKKYVRPSSLEEAYECNQKRANRIIGGMAWIRMGKKDIGTAIDLSDLVSHTIEETKDKFTIGAMVPLHDLELHKGIESYTNGAIKESVRHIVGVQFRNIATVGGSIFGRFGFSDVLTMFLALDTYVELYKGGVVPLRNFTEMPYDNDILLNIIVKKTPVKTAYKSVRLSKTDFPVLACAVSFMEGKRKTVIGARPQKAAVVLADDEIMAMDETTQMQQIAEAFSELAKKQITTGSNMRASAEYRKHLVKVLTKRACIEALQNN